MKWTRANHHLHTISTALDAYSKSGPCTIIPEIEANTGDKVWRVEGEPTPPSPSLNLIIGESLYNYRSSLDHLAWQLVIKAGNIPTSDTAFLICDAIHKFKSQSPARLKGMSKPMRAAIKDLQPCYGKQPHRTRFLGALESLSNIDKHRHFNLTCAAVDGGFWIPGLPLTSVGRTFIYTGPMEHNTILARVPKEYVDVNFGAACGITFDKTGPTTREVLFAINEIVAGTIEDFALTFFGTSLSLQRYSCVRIAGRVSPTPSLLSSHWSVTLRYLA